jgi:glycosyltransferase involved in cell wall biosynthesis
MLQADALSTREQGQSTGCGSGRPLRVLSNTDWLNGEDLLGRPPEIEQLAPRPTLARIVRRPFLLGYDGAFINIGTRWVLALCALKKVLPLGRLRILGVDMVLTRPTSLREVPYFLLKRWLFSGVDRFVFYFRDTAELSRVYRIPHDRLRYVPFKPNTLPELGALTPVDEGFLLACGRSNRDYRTLCEAMRGLPYRCYVLVSNSEADQHGTDLSDLNPPPNVQLVSDDGSAESWNNWMARCRALVVPIVPGMLSPSGISAYLVAMALGKPVIITEGPATRGLLSDDTAVLVPPRDVARLRSAIVELQSDVRRRHAVAVAGRAYALSLGGEERLRADLRREFEDLLAR